MHSIARGVVVSPHRRLRIRFAALGVNMKLHVLSLTYATTFEHLFSALRKQIPFAIVGLGGILTLVWIALVAWIPLRLITSVISIVITEMPSI